ncbi:hypothetical protein [Devosia sp.]|uniref:hypothetical protein n=1 Tax=Devosia sp. TaxID=1871048 RepID=UPI003A943F00
MRPAPILVALAISLVGSADASEAVIEQVPETARTAECALCYNATEEQAAAAREQGIDYYTAAGPPNVVSTIQVGSDNVAVGVSLGENNYIGQFQFGYGNHSTVGVIADDTSVAVVQHGDKLQSNLLIWGNPGAAIAVYQPEGSDPVNAAILTADDGTQVIFPGNATTVIRQ